MSTKEKTLALDEQRARLERRANVIRSRLLRTIDALDTRRHQVEELGHHAKRLAKPMAASVIGIAIIAAGTAFAIRAVVERRRERSFGYRLSKALAPLRTPARPPFWKEALRKVTLSALGMLAAEAAKRGAIRYLSAAPAAATAAHEINPQPTPPLLGA